MQLPICNLAKVKCYFMLRSRKRHDEKIVELLLGDEQVGKLVLAFEVLISLRAKTVKVGKCLQVGLMKGALECRKTFGLRQEVGAGLEETVVRTFEEL